MKGDLVLLNSDEKRFRPQIIGLQIGVIIMESVAWTVGGLLVGAVMAWLIATRRAQSELLSKVSDAERRTATAETKAASYEATTTELRRQFEEVRQKGDGELQQRRARLSSETEARVKAETEKQELSQRLDEEKQLLAEATEKLTNTFKALRVLRLTTAPRPS